MAGIPPNPGLAWISARYFGQRTKNATGENHAQARFGLMWCRGLCPCDLHDVRPSGRRGRTADGYVHGQPHSLYDEHRCKLEVLGNYSVKANVITFTDTSGPWACTGAGEQAGTYSWRYEDSVLTLAKVTDKCSDRVKSLVSRTWRGQS